MFSAKMYLLMKPANHMFVGVTCLGQECLSMSYHISSQLALFHLTFSSNSSCVQNWRIWRHQIAGVVQVVVELCHTHPYVRQGLTLQYFIMATQLLPTVSLAVHPLLGCITLKHASKFCANQHNIIVTYYLSSIRAVVTALNNICIRCMNDILGKPICPLGIIAYGELTL